MMGLLGNVAEDRNCRFGDFVALYSSVPKK
jgi:hypothetical protein